MYSVFSELRRLRNSWSFTLIVVFTIALGIGANTAIFTLVHAVLLRSLPVSNPKMLYRVGEGAMTGVTGGLQKDGNFSLFSFDLYKELQRSTPQFEQLAAFQSGPEGMTVRGNGKDSRSETTEYVSGNYFDTFGVSPFAGRLLNGSDDLEGAPLFAVISYAAWQSGYGSDPSVIGRSFSFQGHAITIVGVGAAGFFGDRTTATPPSFWLPLASEPILEGKSSILRSPSYSWLFVLGRIKSGVSTNALQQQLSATIRNWLETQPAYLKDGGSSQISRQHVVLTPGGSGIQQLQQQQSKGLYLLMAISALVLLVACSNVANLLLARNSARRADSSLRMALGATRPRIVGQMLTESIILACLGGAAGIGLAYAGTRVILSLAFPDAPQLPIHAAPSLPVLGFAFLLSLLTGIIFGVGPAWLTTHVEPAEALRGVNRSTRDRAALPQRLLIIFQAAMSLILLVGASMLTRSLANLQNQDLGLQLKNRYVVRIDPAGAGYAQTGLANLYQSIERGFKADPTVDHVGMALYSPLEGTNWSTEVVVPGRKQGEPGSPSLTASDIASYDRVSDDFFAAVGEQLTRGRTFTDADSGNTQAVVVINESFAKKFFPGENPLGRSFGSVRRTSKFQIVGVVADAKFVDPSKKTDVMFFRPLAQSLNDDYGKQSQMESLSSFADSIILDFKVPPTNVDELVRHTLTNINPNLTAIKLQTFSYQAQANFTQDRLLARLASLFSALALTLAGVGLYGVMAYQVTRRTSEIGLRIALGATRGSMINLVLRGAFARVGTGLAIGLPVALLAARFVSSQLYEVSFYDPQSLVFAVAALLVVAAAASFIPARRAASVEPVTALRIQ
jgi:predicted permease